FAIVHCETSVRVPVTAQRVTRGMVLRDRHLEMGWQPVGRTDHDFIRTKEQLVGKIMKRSLQIGEGITRAQIKVPQIVRRGQLLELTVKRNGLQVTSEVKAMENAGYGDTIDVMHMGNHKRMRAR